MQQKSTSSRRTKRACDRCRFKKAKCDGKQPCATCRTHDCTCLYSARRRREIRNWLCEMQEIMNEAIKRLYLACKDTDTFPGVIPSNHRGPITTDVILRAMGLLNPEGCSMYQHPSLILGDKDHEAWQMLGQPESQETPSYLPETLMSNNSSCLDPASTEESVHSWPGFEKLQSAPISDISESGYSMKHHRPRDESVGRSEEALSEHLGRFDGLILHGQQPLRHQTLDDAPPEAMAGKISPPLHATPNVFFPVQQHPYSFADILPSNISLVSHHMPHVVSPDCINPANLQTYRSQESNFPAPVNRTSPYHNFRNPGITRHDYTVSA